MTNNQRNAMTKQFMRLTIACLWLVAASASAAPKTCPQVGFEEFVEKFMGSVEVQQKHTRPRRYSGIRPEPNAVRAGQQLGDLAQFLAPPPTEMQHFHKPVFPIIPNRAYMQQHGLAMDMVVDNLYQHAPEGCAVRFYQPDADGKPSHKPTIYYFNRFGKDRIANYANAGLAHLADSRGWFLSIIDHHTPLLIDLAAPNTTQSHNADICSKDNFGLFLQAFVDSPELQKKHTRLPLEYGYWKPGTKFLYDAGDWYAKQPMVIEMLNEAPPSIKQQLARSPTARLRIEYLYWGPGHETYRAHVIIRPPKASTSRRGNIYGRISFGYNFKHKHDCWTLHSYLNLST